MLDLLKRLVREEEGQGMVEYALIIVAIALAVMVFLPGVGTQIGAKFEEIRVALGGTPK